MPAPGVIERLAAQSMLGADAEDIAKTVEGLMAQSEEQVEMFRDLEKRSHYHEPPHNLKKKKKAKRRQQKQSRKRK